MKHLSCTVATNCSLRCDSKTSTHFFPVACGILAPQPGIEPVPPAVEVWSLSHWTAREVSSIHFSFLLHNFMDRRFILTVDLSNFSICFFPFLIKSRPFTFPLKEVLYGISLVYPNCQHHYSCALGPLLSKIRVTCTQVLQHCDSRSDNQDRWHKLDKEMIHVQSGTA